MATAMPNRHIERNRLDTVLTWTAAGWVGPVTVTNRRGNHDLARSLGRSSRGGEHLPHMPHDHQVLVGRDDADDAAAVRPADRVRVGGVALGVEPEPEMIQPLTGLPAHWSRPLADSSGEHEGVEAAERCRERADLLPDLVTEHGDRLGGGRLTLPALEQRLHVGTQTRDTEEPRLVVHQTVEPIAVVALLSQQIEQHARVKVATAR